MKTLKFPFEIHRPLESVRGMFYLKDVGEIVKLSCEPNIVHELLFPLNDSDNIFFFSFFCSSRINIFNRYGRVIRDVEREAKTKCNF